MVGKPPIPKIYPQVIQKISDEGFPLLTLRPPKPFYDINRRRRVIRGPTVPVSARCDQMNEKQDWPSLWPSARIFTPSSVPLDVRQSYEKKHGPSRTKYANTELLKISNFLHLGPPAVKRHCQALKKFCTPWPAGLESAESIREHFPITYVTRDYVQTGPTIRNKLARIVELRVHLSSLRIDKKEDSDKLKKLAGERFDEDSQMLTISASACPSRVQNKDYTDYLLRALYFESLEHEEWEKEKPKEVKQYKSVEELDEYRNETMAKLGFSN